MGLNASANAEDFVFATQRQIVEVELAFADFAGSGGNAAHASGHEERER
ncbi:MAG: hypothetical protein ACLPSH_19820 [Vulcanimicrobiaceae bacterium]